MRKAIRDVAALRRDDAMKEESFRVAAIPRITNLIERPADKPNDDEERDPKKRVAFAILNALTIYLKGDDFKDVKCWEEDHRNEDSPASYFRRARRIDEPSPLLPAPQSPSIHPVPRAKKAANPDFAAWDFIERTAQEHVTGRAFGPDYAERLTQSYRKYLQAGGPPLDGMPEYIRRCARATTIVFV